MPMLVSAGSISTQATSPAASSAASESRSLNSATRVVRSVLAKGHERLVDGAMVAVVEDQDLRPAGDQPGESQRPAVGVAGGEGEAPQRHSEAAGQFRADPGGVGGGQHRGRA